jgi:endonuclease/exonuclease/phosphatase family metal-dependent hydrolase
VCAHDRYYAGLCAGVTGIVTESNTSAGKLVRFSTYNVRNLFLSPQGGHPEEKPGKELKALIGTIDKVGADVLCLQEVGSRYALEQLNNALRSPYPHLELLPGNSAREIHLGMLSRYSFSATTHRDHGLAAADGAPMHEYLTEDDAAAQRLCPLRFQRDVLLAELTIEGAGCVAVFNVHLKSRTNAPWRHHGADDVRAAEARELATIVGKYMATHAERPVLLLGDFNDTKHSPALAAIVDLGLADPLGEQLETANANPSTYWPKRRMRIDFILASAAAQQRMVPGSGAIHASQMAARASDHYPVSVDFRFAAGAAALNLSGA